MPSPNPVSGRSPLERRYLAARAKCVREHFPRALGMDDFVHRLEIALFRYGFSGDSAIACLNLCRDEITGTLKNKIDNVFGHTFNVNGLGGVLTSGVLGMGAGLSHSPVDIETGKERYIFFSFPHIACSPYNDPGVLCRHNRAGKSSACGALIKALSDLKSEGLDTNCKQPGVHEPENPEYSILKQRLARMLKFDGYDESSIQNLTLIELTKTAEKTITLDLQNLISKAVDPHKADYAVITGVQIHSWGKDQSDGTPNLEYIQPCSAYAVIGGKKIPLNIMEVPALTPRQEKELSAIRGGGYFGSGDLPPSDDRGFEPHRSFEVDGTQNSVGNQEAQHYDQLLKNLEATAVSVPLQVGKA